MRFLETDVDLILLALAVVPIVWAVSPSQRADAPHGNVVIVCHGTACGPAPLPSPDNSADR